MAILGTRAAAINWDNFNHSLPATNPEVSIPVLRSMQNVAVGAYPQLAWVAANASQVTVGLIQPSTPTQPVVAYDAFSIVFYSTIR